MGSSACFYARNFPVRIRLRFTPSGSTATKIPSGEVAPGENPPPGLAKQTMGSVSGSMAVGHSTVAAIVTRAARAKAQYSHRAPGQIHCRGTLLGDG